MRGPKEDGPRPGKFSAKRPNKQIQSEGSISRTIQVNVSFPLPITLLSYRMSGLHQRLQTEYRRLRRIATSLLVGAPIALMGSQDSAT